MFHTHSAVKEAGSWRQPELDLMAATTLGIVGQEFLFRSVHTILQAQVVLDTEHPTRVVLIGYFNEAKELIIAPNDEEPRTWTAGDVLVLIQRTVKRTTKKKHDNKGKDAKPSPLTAGGDTGISALESAPRSKDSPPPLPGSPNSRLPALNVSHKRKEDCEQ